MAAAFSRAGARVALVARSRGPLDDVVDAMEGETLVCPVDVASPEGNRSVVDAVERAWGGLDVWIANAGISPVVASVLDMDPEDWRNIHRVNLDGAFYGAQAASRSMAANGGGRIIVTTSALAERPRRGLVGYCASKAGATAMVKAMALDLAKHDITVNAVNDDPDSFRAALVKLAKIPEALTKAIHLPTWKTSIDVKSLQFVEEHMEKYGIITNPVDVSKLVAK